MQTVQVVTIKFRRVYMLALKYPRLDHSPLSIRNSRKFCVIRLFCDELCGIILKFLRDRIRQPSTGIPFAVQDINQGVTSFLAWHTSPDQGSHVGVLDPRFENKRTRTAHDDYGIVILPCDSIYEVVSITPRRKVLSISRIPINSDEGLPTVSTDEYKSGRAFCSQVPCER